MLRFHRSQKLVPPFCLALAIVVAACGQAPTSRSPSAPIVSTAAAGWTFQWDDSVPTSTPLPQAFLASGAALDAQGDVHPPASVRWLAVQPTFGLALVQLDPAGSWMSMVYFQANSTWTIAGEFDLARPTAHTGSTANQALSLPHDLYASRDFLHLYDPHFTMRLWLSPTRTYALGYVRTTSGIIPPTAHPVTVDQRQGWLSSSADFQEVIVPMGSETLIFGGSADTAEIERLAGEGVAHVAMLTTGGPTD